MTGAIVMTITAVLCAGAVLAAVVAAQRPAEGWLGWIRESYRAWRSDELSWHEDGDRDAVGGLGALYLMSEPGNAYSRPEEFGSEVAERLWQQGHEGITAMRVRRPRSSGAQHTHAGA